MEKTLDCCRLLAKHKNPHTAQQLRSIAGDQNQVVLLFKRVARSLSKMFFISALRLKLPCPHVQLSWAVLASSFCIKINILMS